MLLLLKFLHPYLLFCNLAAWGLAQNLEGLGLFHYINDVPMRVGNEVIYPLNFSPIHGVNGLSGVLTLMLIPISLLNIRAGWPAPRWLTHRDLSNCATVVRIAADIRSSLVATKNVST